MKQTIWNAVTDAKIIGITGHVRPDGDCVGSCMAMYQYIKKYFKDKEVYVYLELVPDVFSYISGVDEVITDYEDKNVDLFISIDCSDIERIGDAKELFLKAAKTINIDHHVSNNSFADINHFEPHSSSACEVLYELLDADKVDFDIATSLYTGIIHDTGVLKYSNTSKRTMQIVGELIDKNINFTTIIDESFYEKTYTQNLILGRSLLESRLVCDNKAIICVLTSEIMNEYNATKADLDGIVNAILLTKGAEVAVFIYELEENVYKVSLRAAGDVDVNAIAGLFGGGGHVKASGCSIEGNLEEGIEKILNEVEKSLK